MAPRAPAPVVATMGNGAFSSPSAAPNDRKEPGVAVVKKKKKRREREESLDSIDPCLRPGPVRERATQNGGDDTERTTGVSADGTNQKTRGEDEVQLKDTGFDMEGTGGVAGLMASGKPPVRAEVPDTPPTATQTSIISDVSGIAADEVYGKDETALNTFLKLHPMLST